MKIRRFLAGSAVATVVAFAALHHHLILPGSFRTVRSPGGAHRLLVTSENALRHNGSMKLAVVVVDSRTGEREATLFTGVDTFGTHRVEWDDEYNFMIKDGDHNRILFEKVKDVGWIRVS